MEAQKAAAAGEQRGGWRLCQWRQRPLWLVAGSQSGLSASAAPTDARRCLCRMHAQPQPGTHSSPPRQPCTRRAPRTALALLARKLWWICGEMLATLQFSSAVWRRAAMAGLSPPSQRAVQEDSLALPTGAGGRESGDRPQSNKPHLVPHCNQTKTEHVRLQAVAAGDARPGRAAASKRPPLADITASPPRLLLPRPARSTGWLSPDDCVCTSLPCVRGVGRPTPATLSQNRTHKHTHSNTPSLPSTRKICLAERPQLLHPACSPTLQHHSRC